MNINVTIVQYFANVGMRALASSVAVSLMIFWGVLPANAQTTSNEEAIVPDTTLGAEGSRLRFVNETEPQAEILIEGGAQRGESLFHSFDRFSVEENTTVRFVVPLAGAVERIFARISGNRSTQILGTLGTTAAADLFLINPNGVFFGPNASLDIRGSFVASTAESILFEDGFAFGTDNPQAPPLLTVDVPVGLQLGQDPAPIEIQDGGNNSIVGDILDLAFTLPSFGGPLLRPDEIEGALQVPEGQTLALVGGPVTLDGALLVAESGQVILGGAGPNEQVGLLTRPEGWGLDFSSVSQFENLEIGARSLVDASGTFEGEIELVGKNITLDDQSLVLISQENISEANFGGIEIVAADLLQAITSTIVIQSVVGDAGAGTLVTANPSTITVTAGDVFFSNSGGIVARTFSAWDSAAVEVDVDNTLTLQEIFQAPNPLFRVPARLTTTTFSGGNGGDVRINATDVQLVRGVALGSLSIAPGMLPSESIEGSAGNVTVRAKNSIELDGIFPDTPFGNTQLLASSFTSGDGGMITVETGKLTFRDGALVNGSSFGAGSAGDTFIVAREAIEITGSGLFTQPGQPAIFRTSAIEAGVDAGLLVLDPEQSGLSIPSPDGESGNLTVITPFLSLDLDAELTVGNEGPNDGGTLDIFANQVFVGNRAQIAASTFDGQGGTISIRPLAQVPESLLSSLPLADPEGLQQVLTAQAATQLTLDGLDAAITAQALPPIEVTDEETGEPRLTMGNAGGVEIDLDEIVVRDGASINVSSSLGEGGTLTIEADTLELDGGNITALAGSSGSDGTLVGNIELNLEDNLFLRNESSISAEAQGEANGGNVNISTQLVVATPPSGPVGSDIIANAEAGNGGSITIQTEGLLGLDLRDQDTALNDILVTSELGVDGELTIESPEIDPQDSIAVLPENLTDSANLIVAGCAAENADFALVGRGGLPTDPTAPLQAQSLWQDLREPEATTATDSTDKDRPQPQIATPDAPQRLVEAQGWSVDRNGQVVLLASEKGSPLQQPHCRQLQAMNIAQ